MKLLLLLPVIFALLFFIPTAFAQNQGISITVTADEGSDTITIMGRPHLIKTQWASGGASDFLDSAYLVTASTSYIALSLQAGLEPVERGPVAGGPTEPGAEGGER